MTSFQEILLLSIVGAVAIILLGFSVRLYILTKRINGAFAKLGFIVREDAKKYFDDAAGKIVDTNGQLQELYRKVVEESTKEVLVNSGEIMEKSVGEAQARAGQIILQAQTDAQNIIAQAKRQAETEHSLAVQKAVDTIGWTMEQYLKEKYDAAQHEELITRIITAYVNERRN